MKLIYSAILLAIGAFLGFWVKRRRFQRMNQYGVEEFPNFKEKVIATTIERLLWWTGLSCIAVGGFLIII